MADEYFAFDRNAAERIVRSVKKSEQNTSQQPSRNANTVAPLWTEVIQLQSVIEGTTTTTLNSGPAKLAYLSTDDVLEVSTQTVTAYNLSQVDGVADLFYRAQRDPIHGQWLFGESDAGQITRFELTGTLVVDGSAAAETLDDTLTKTGTAITVHDTVGKWAGDIGYQGFAAWAADAGRWEILFLEGHARWIEFTLTSTFSGGSATASLSTFWGDAPNGKEPTIASVYDPLDKYSKLASGTKGHAVLNENSTQYIVFDADVESGGVLAGVAYQQWEDGSSVPTVKVNPTPTLEAADADVDTEHTVKLPRTAPGDPNVQIGALLSYSLIEGSTEYVCLTDYMDRQIGTVEMRVDDGEIPGGWRDMDDDGTGSKMDMRGRFPRGWNADLTGSTTINASTNENDVTETGGDDYFPLGDHYLTLKPSGTDSGSNFFDDSKPHHESPAGTTQPQYGFENRPAFGVLRFIERVDNSQGGYAENVPGLSIAGGYNGSMSTWDDSGTTFLNNGFD